MNGFSINDATYARSRAGLNLLINNLQGDFKKAGEKLTGSEYNVVINTIRKNWSGDDADKFIASFKRDVQEAKVKIQKYGIKIERTLRNDYDNFIHMQTMNSGDIRPYL